MTPKPIAFPGAISGTVFGIGGSSLSGASITLDSTGATTTSDTAGSFHIAEVVAGNHTLTIIHSSYFDTVLSPVAVAMDSLTTGVAVNMTPKLSAFPGTIGGTILGFGGNPLSGCINNTRFNWGDYNIGYCRKLSSCRNYCGKPLTNCDSQLVLRHGI